MKYLRSGVDLRLQNADVGHIAVLLAVIQTVALPTGQARREPLIGFEWPEMNPGHSEVLLRKTLVRRVRRRRFAPSVVGYGFYAPA